MNFYTPAFAFYINVTLLINISYGFYIKNQAENESTKPQKGISNANNEIKWSILKQKLGLTNQKVEVLKAQKDQTGTLALLNRFIDENASYSVNKAKTVARESSNSFLKAYYNILKQLKLSPRKMKTSLNFELADGPQNNLERSRRKIAVKMVSDIPSEKIDELLKIFNEKHDINNHDNDDAEIDYKDFHSSVPSDYMYENLYEDEEDLAVPAKSNHNSQYGSLQDLILQASRNQWLREIEEMKLRNRNNEHFI